MTELLSVRAGEYRGFPIISLKGDLDYNHIEVIDEAMGKIELAPLIIVDFTELDYLDSAGLKWLISWRAKHGGMILVIALSANTKKILDITGILPFFPTFDDIDSASQAIDSLVELAHKSE